MIHFSKEPLFEMSHFQNYRFRNDPTFEVTNLSNCPFSRWTQFLTWIIFRSDPFPEWPTFEMTHLRNDPLFEVTVFEVTHFRNDPPSNWPTFRSYRFPKWPTFEMTFRNDPPSKWPTFRSDRLKRPFFGVIVTRPLSKKNYSCVAPVIWELPDEPEAVPNRPRAISSASSNFSSSPQGGSLGLNLPFRHSIFSTISFVSWHRTRLHKASEKTEIPSSPGSSISPLFLVI